MNISLADQYFLKAQDAFHYDADELAEALNYAIGYDDEHAQSICLLGRVYMEKLKDFEAARHCFERAIIADQSYIETYKYYMLLLIWIGEFEKAENLIKRAEKIKGMPKVVILQRRATLYECQGKVNLALEEIKKGKLLSACSNFYAFFNQEEKRLSKKVCYTKEKKSSI